MGILWTVWPLDDQMRSWLDEQDIAYPALASRFPTGREIRDVLASLPRANIEMGENGVGGALSAFVTVQADGEERWTRLEITNFTGDDQSQKLWFENGHEELIVDILARLAMTSGPLALMADVGGPPQIISAYQ